MTEPQHTPHPLEETETMKLRMELGPRSYDIVLKRGSLAGAGRLANLGRKVLVLSDTGVPSQYVQTIAQQCGQPFPFIVEQGEDSKSVKTWQQILTHMLEHGFERGDAVASVGGGVVGDLGGFVAAAYMRGISFFQFPTTTLSQVDSSIGGKVAINLAGTKNTIGAFHQPELVVVDPDTLATLPPRHYANGLAEALKTGLIGNSDLFNIFEKEDVDANIERILYLCLEYKKGVVERDETEQGERKLLNFGHTIGHGIEAAGGLSGLLHGESVALGMLPMIESRTLLRRTKAILRKLHLPLSYNYPAEKVLSYITSDKKRHGDSYTIIKVKKPGMAYLEDVTFEELKMLVQGDTE